MGLHWSTFLVIVLLSFVSLGRSQCPNSVVLNISLTAPEITASNCNASLCALTALSCENVSCTPSTPCEIVQCIDGSCVITGFQPFCCIHDSDCPQSGGSCTIGTCTNYTCVYTPSGCTQDSQCTNGTGCIQCQCLNVSCTLDSECNDGVVCTMDFCGLDHVCRNLVIPNCCQNNTDCIDPNNSCTFNNQCLLNRGICITIPVDADHDGYDCFLDCNDSDPFVNLPSEFFRDMDGDGYGNASVHLFACTPPLGYAVLSTDCNDSDSCIHPNQTDFCNGIDWNCNGIINGANDSVDCLNMISRVNGSFNPIPCPSATPCAGLSFADAFIGGTPAYVVMLAQPGPSHMCINEYVLIANPPTTSTSSSITPAPPLCTMTSSSQFVKSNGSSIPQSASLADMGGVPGVAVTITEKFAFRYSYNSAQDGSNAWITNCVIASTIPNVCETNSVISVSLLNIAGSNRPGIVFVNQIGPSGAGILQFATNPAANGSGTWTITNITSGIGNYDEVYACYVFGLPAFAARRQSPPGIDFVINSLANGTGIWTINPIINLTTIMIGRISMGNLPNGYPYIAYSNGSALLNNLLTTFSNSTIGSVGSWTTQTVDGMVGYKINTRAYSFTGKTFIAYTLQPNPSVGPLLRIAENCNNLQGFPDPSRWMVKTISSVSPPFTFYPDVNVRPGLLSIPNPMSLVIPFSQIADQSAVEEVFQ